MCPTLMKTDRKEREREKEEAVLWGQFYKQRLQVKSEPKNEKKPEELNRLPKLV